MSQFLSRAQDWFRARSTAEKTGIIVLAFIVLLAASRVLAAVAGLAFFAVVIVLIVQLFRRRPVRPWAIAAVGSLAAVILFSSIAGALYEPQTEQRGQQGERAKEQVAKPSQPETEKSKFEEAKPPPPKEPEEKKSEPENAGQNGAPDNDGVEDEATPAGPTTDEGEDGFGPTVTVERAVDGDTIEISPAVDDENTVRLIGIDTPESVEPGCEPQPLGQEAADHAATWEGREVELEFDEERKDQYGRLLAYVHNDLIMATSMNVDMIESGYAQVYIVPPNTKHEDELREAQSQAKNLSLGFGLDIWSLPPEKDAQIADRGNGIGSGDGACAAEEPSSASASASASASPQPDSEANRRNRGGGNAPSSAVPDGEDASAPAGGATNCDQVDGPIRIDPNNDPHGLDGDGDGIACED